MAANATKTLIPGLTPEDGVSVLGSSVTGSEVSGEEDEVKVPFSHCSSKTPHCLWSQVAERTNLRLWFSAERNPSSGKECSSESTPEDNRVRWRRAPCRDGIDTYGQKELPFFPLGRNLLKEILYLVVRIQIDE